MLTWTPEDLERLAGLRPAKDFAINAMIRNTELANEMCKPGFVEYFGMRQTGRSTRLFINAIHRCTKGQDVIIYTTSPASAEILAAKCNALVNKICRSDLPTKGKYQIWMGQRFIKFRPINAIDLDKDICATRLFDECLNEV